MSSDTIDTVVFPDANLTLTTPTHHFRVNKDLLIDKAGFFKDLFETGTQEETPGEEPKIPVQDDPEVFNAFIHSLHDENLDRFFPKLRRSTTNLISHVLDLYDKYIVDSEGVRPKLTPYILRDWPESLSDWDANEEVIQEIQLELQAELEKKGSYLGSELDELLPEPATVIRFAYIYAPSEKAVQPVPPYLPAAFYHLSRIPPYADPDESIFSEADYYDNFGLRTAKKSLLRERDFINVMQGIHEIRNEIAKLAFEEFPAEVKKGDQSEAETKIMLDWWRKFGFLKLLGPDDGPDPLQRLKEIIDSLEENTSDGPDFVALYQGTSLAFRRRMRAYLTSEREGLWAGLTDRFSLFSFFY